MKNNKRYLIVFGIFALVIVTTAASYAFFNYSRVGNTTTTITSGDIEFSFIEGSSAELANAFPVSDSVGAKDTTKEYTFDVNMKSSSTSNKMNYNVYLLDANDDENTNYFTNDQIKFALVKNGAYVAGTSGEEGKLLSDMSGFTAGEIHGEAIILQNQEIVSNVTDTYKLRIWISDEVNYSNTEDTEDGTDINNDSQTSTGKYNGYKYSLKVKVSASVNTNNIINNVVSRSGTVNAVISDPSGISAYAITTSSTAPASDSSNWINITDVTAKSTTGNVVRIANVTTKSITHKTLNKGTYYIHVKNKLNEINTSEPIVVDSISHKATDYIKWLYDDAGITYYGINYHDYMYVDDYGNYRFKGVAVDGGFSTQSFVRFNGSNYWRILGIFKVDDGNGNIQERIKLAAYGQILGKFGWDTIQNVGTVHTFDQSELKNLLNGDYYNGNASATCGISINNPSCTLDAVLNEESRQMIGDAVWKTGTSFTTNFNEMYEAERDSKSSYVGKVGLLSASDILGTNYMADNGRGILTLNGTDQAFISLGSNSYEMKNINDYNYDVFPVVYLLPDIKIIAGNGGAAGAEFVLSK